MEKILFKKREEQMKKSTTPYTYKFEHFTSIFLIFFFLIIIIRELLLQNCSFCVGEVMVYVTND